MSCANKDALNSAIAEIRETKGLYAFCLSDFTKRAKMSRDNKKVEVVIELPADQLGVTDLRSLNQNSSAFDDLKLIPTVVLIAQDEYETTKTNQQEK